MRLSTIHTTRLTATSLSLAALFTLASGCGGGGGGSSGGGGAQDAVAPTVDATHPTRGESGVALNQRVSVQFSEAMAQATLSAANVTVTGPSGVVAGSLTYAAASRILTFTPAADLAPTAVYTVTVLTGVQDLASNPLGSTYTWSFTTSASRDVTAPTVTYVLPAQGATGVALNTKVVATFSEPMQAASFDEVTFTLVQGSTAVPGVVSYSDAGRTALFAPSTQLLASTPYTATVTTGARDLANNALLVARTWSFTTGVALDTAAPSVTATNPTSAAMNVPTNKKVNATWSESLDPSTVTTLSYRLVGPGGVSVVGTVAYEASDRITTFVPAADLATNTLYTATLTTAVRDLAGVALLNDYTWSFTTGQSAAQQQPVDLRSAGRFAVLAGSTVTNTGPTVVNGDLGLSPGSAVVGFPPGTVNGTTHTTNPTAAQAQLDLTTAYNDAQGRTLNPIALPTNMGGLTLAPGLYVNANAVQLSGTGANGVLTLDAQGDTTAVWIFQLASSLESDSGTSIVLAGGAKASNIFWAVGSSAIIGTTSVWYGTIMTDQSVTLRTGATLNGRALARIAAVSLDAASVTIPPP